MAALIYNLRGTNGSGKTTFARELLKKSNACIHRMRTKSKPAAYTGEYKGKRIAVLGSYESVCGGMDTITDINEAVELVREYGASKEFQIVFFEGLFISHSIGAVGEATRTFGDKAVLAFLDTPLETCISRVVQRRTERGDLRPFDPKNVVKDHGSVERCYYRASVQGFNAQLVDHLAIAKHFDACVRRWAK